MLLVTGFNSLRLLVVFLVDLGVVLVLAAATLVVLEAVLLVNGVLHVRHQVAVLAVQRILELRGGRVALKTLVFAGVLGDSLGVAVVGASVSVVLRELDLEVVLSPQSRGDRPGCDLARVVFHGPACSEVDHRLALAVSKLVEQLVQFVVQENAVVSLDFCNQALHHFLASLPVNHLIVVKATGHVAPAVELDLLSML